MSLGRCHIGTHLCSSGNPCTLLATIAAVRSLSPATLAAPGPLGYISDHCRKECASSLVHSIERGKSPQTPEHTWKMVGMEASCTGRHHRHCTAAALTQKPSKQCAIYYVSALPGIAVTMAFPTLPGTWPRASKAHSPPTCTLQLWKRQYTPGTMSSLVLAFRRSHSMMLLSSWSFYLKFSWELHIRTALRPKMPSY